MELLLTSNGKVRLHAGGPLVSSPGGTPGRGQAEHQAEVKRDTRRRSSGTPDGPHAERTRPMRHAHTALALTVYLACTHRELTLLRQVARTNPRESGTVTAWGLSGAACSHQPQLGCPAVATHKNSHRVVAVSVDLMVVPIRFERTTLRFLV